VSVKLYMDVHVKAAITEGLRARGVDVLTAQEDGSRRLLDADLLDRATDLGRVLFSQDKDLLREGARRQREGEPFSGVICAHQQEVSIGQCVHDLEVMALAGEPEDLARQVEYLPLR
jgi:predicted nuclease of predicted toxin-antitoxin system